MLTGYKYHRYRVVKDDSDIGRWWISRKAVLENDVSWLTSWSEACCLLIDWNINSQPCTTFVCCFSAKLGKLFYGETFIPKHLLGLAEQVVLLSSFVSFVVFSATFCCTDLSFAVVNFVYNVNVTKTRIIIAPLSLSELNLLEGSAPTFCFQMIPYFDCYFGVWASKLSLCGFLFVV